MDSLGWPGSAPFLSNGWRGKGQLLLSVHLFSNLGEMHLCLSQRGLLSLSIYLIVPFFFSSSQRDLTPAIPTVDHILCTIVRYASHSENCSSVDLVFGDCIYIHIYERKVTPAYLLATWEFRSCFSISAGVEGAVMGQRTVAGRGKDPENHLQWKPRLATWLCVHARLYGLAMSLTSGKPSVIQRLSGIKCPNNVCWVVSCHGLTW